MITDNAMVLILLSFLAVAQCTDLLAATASSSDEIRAEPSGQPTVQLVNVEDHHHAESDESTTVMAEVKAVGRTGKQYYQPMNTYEYQQYPQRRAYHKGPNYSLKKKLKKIKAYRRPRPRRRPVAPPPPMSMMKNRYRRLPQQPVRAQHVNYIDTASGGGGGGVDYEDGGYESAPQSVSLDYGEHEFVHEPTMTYAYGPAGSMAAAVPMAVIAPTASSSSSSRSRKRPAATGYVDVPVRVAFSRPATPAVPVTTADPMDKLRQLVHEAMDAHFANKHQELYSDGFDKQHHQLVYSSKYKRPKDKDKDKQQQVIDAIKTTASTSTKKDVSSQDADADGSDDRLTLAEISAYMGAKPAETVLSAGGHRYVLSDALQQSYRQQQQQPQPQPQYGDENHQQRFVRYVSPFESLYELPGVRWTY